MNFLKKHSYDIVKLFVNQLGIAIFSMALYNAVAIALPNDFVHTPTITLIISIISTLFYLYLIYIVVWEFGAKDKIRIDGGHLSPQPLKGFLLQMCANIPNYLLIAIASVCFGIYFSNGNEGCKLAFGALHSFVLFIESMYTGIIISIFPLTGDAVAEQIDIVYFWRTILYFVMPLISVVVAQIAYMLGEHNIKIISFLSGKKNK